MSLTKETYQAYCDILKEELRLAMGCTEPIAIAYSASVARSYMEQEPTSITINLSGNIIKNTKSVVVPATGGMHGIPAAVIAGTVANKPELVLEVLSALNSEDIPKMQAMMENCPVEVKELDTTHIFEIVLVMKNESEDVRVRLLDRHTNLVYVEKNGQVLLRNEQEEEDGGIKTDRTLLNVEDIVAFADEVDIEDVRELLERQIECNMAIAEEGLTNDYGACIGKIIYKNGECSLPEKARAFAAAGSDARMNGCEMPVCIISGSGNQGMTASIPVVVYARELGKSHEELLRAVLVSDLITTHLKTGIGCLSAYCGAISAGCGCGAGIAYLNGGKFKEIAHTIVNALAVLSGTICDGAKSSCAAKIAMAVESGILGYEMYQNGSQFYGGDGIVTKGVENTIANVGRLASQGMSGTDKEIIRIMLQ
ncbi:MAG: serine dehydratase subunit alpha family protein [Lachnospiraceae bacterium]|nr:serine dehydratase subunit alpha family protein [Lachnospiraceae bacterium]